MHAHHVPWESRTHIAHRMVAAMATHLLNCPMIKRLTSCPFQARVGLHARPSRGRDLPVCGGIECSRG